jgi:hypothetical protein
LGDVQYNNLFKNQNIISENYDNQEQQNKEDFQEENENGFTRISYEGTKDEENF